MTIASATLVSELSATPSKIKKNIGDLTTAEDARSAIDEINRLWRFVKSRERGVKVRADIIKTKATKPENLRNALLKFVDSRLITADDRRSLALEYGGGGRTRAATPATPKTPAPGGGPASSVVFPPLGGAFGSPAPTPAGGSGGDSGARGRGVPAPVAGRVKCLPLHEHVKRACRRTFDHIEKHGKRKSMDHIYALREVHKDLEKALKFIKKY